MDAAQCPDGSWSSRDYYNNCEWEPCTYAPTVTYPEDPWSEQCGANEEYSECGTHCETTCSNMHDGLQPCIDACKAGCFCTVGHVRDQDGSCVRRDQCPTIPPRDPCLGVAC